MEVFIMRNRRNVILVLTLLILCAGPLWLAAATPVQGDDGPATEAERELGEIISQIRLRMQTEPAEEVVKMAEDKISGFIEKYKGQDEEAQGRFTLGQVYTAMGKDEMAVKQYELALKAAVTMEGMEKALLIYSLASSYAKTEQFDKAKESYNRILEEDLADNRIKQAVRKDLSMLETMKKLTPGSPAISFPEETENLSGENMSIEDYQGSVVLIDFWATWCKPCRQEMPHVKKVYEQYRDDGFVIIGVSLDRTREKLVSYIEDNDIEWPQIYDGPGGRIATSYAVSAIPSTFLLNREGEIVHRNLRGKALEEAVSELCEKD
ncbi:MAG: redoxin domain-containing protein [Candidatus Latescibacteria bacterium]|nr:redoxin domain-containing protein [bacterium]MBD3422833.1 redoxin domain-containing protein [Candidatus Latescibacterota bacterium]